MYVVGPYAGPRGSQGRLAKGDTTMTERMKAAMVDAFGNPLEIEEVPIPTPGSRKIQRSSMKTLRKQTLRIYGGLTIVIMGTAPCGAIDYQPFDFVPQVPNKKVLWGKGRNAPIDELL